MAFSARQVEHLTGLSARRLAYWDQLGFYGPEFSNPDEKQGAFGRIYSFRDVVSLRALAKLRRYVSFQEIRAASEHLHRFHDQPWSGLTLYALGGKIIFQHPDTGELFAARSSGIWRGSHTSQPAMRVPMRQIAGAVERRIKRWQQRSKAQVGHVEQNKYVAHNLPVIAGTRIPTTAIWDFHIAGYEPNEILEQYPSITVEDVKVAIDYERGRREPKKQAS